MKRSVHLIAAVVLEAMSMATAPATSAVAPPPVNDALLPDPNPPAPPQPTEQQEQCFGSAANHPDTAGFAQLKYLLDLLTIWDLTQGAGQTVAVIDTGVTRHRLLPHLVPGGDYVFTGDGTEDCDGHGTIVAGIVGEATDSTDADAFGSIAPDATIIGIRQSSNKFRPSDQHAVSGFGDVDTLAMAIRTAADMGATVINVSSVACLLATDPLDDRALGAALSYAVDVKNVVVVAAAGNVGESGQCPEQNPTADLAGSGQPDWDAVTVVASPAWYDEYVLTVRSVGPNGTPSRFSLAGPWVDVAAPGEGIVSLDPDGEGWIDALPSRGGLTPISGTSYAAPVVSGIAALVRSRWPQLTARQVMERIEATAHRPAAGWDPLVGHGVVDALAAVSDSTAPGPRINDTPRSASSAPAADADPQPRRVAFAGAAICIAVTATVAMTASAGRSRRRDAVTHD